MSSKKTKGEEFLHILESFLADPKGSKTPHYCVADLIQACGKLQFRSMIGETGLTRTLSATKVQLLGLALGGYLDDLDAGSVQILGKAELRFINERASEDPRRFLEPMLKSEIGCIIIPDLSESSDEWGVTPDFLDRAHKAGMPVLCSPMPRSVVEAKVLHVLEEQLAPCRSFHGNLVVFCGLGLLILGKSGIGKSDCALDLITHGHQLVADDVVQVRRNALGQLIGRSRDLIRNHMDVRGVGIVNVKELFSVYSVIEEHPIDLLILLERWDPEKNYACFNEQASLDILAVVKPMIRLPVSPGRNWVNLIQVAVRKFLLQSKGYDAEEQLVKKLGKMLKTD